MSHFVSFFYSSGTSRTTRLQFMSGRFGEIMFTRPFSFVYCLHICAAVFILARGHNNHVLVSHTHTPGHTHSRTYSVGVTSSYFFINRPMWRPSVIKRPHILWCRLEAFISHNVIVLTRRPPHSSSHSGSRSGWATCFGASPSPGS